jgi:hypothetical protein
MTELTTTPRRNPQTYAPPTVIKPMAAPEPTLITEQQVLFGTAAAVALPPVRTRGWTYLVGSFAAAVRRAAGPPERVPHHHSERYAYLQTALMSREMGRL